MLTGFNLETPPIKKCVPAAPEGYTFLIKGAKRHNFVAVCQPFLEKDGGIYKKGILEVA